MKKIIFLAIIPLIFLIGITLYLPTAQAQVLPKLVTDDPKYFEAHGYGLAILEYNEWPTTPYDYLKESFPVLTPLAQLNSGILPFDIQCKNNLELMVKPTEESSACVNPNSVMKLTERNWIHVLEPAVALVAAGSELEDEESGSKTEGSNAETIKIQSYPLDDQRAMSYVVTFSGGILSVEQMEPIHTISKFQHLSKLTDSTILLSDDTTYRPQFALEALPSLDKRVYYGMIQDWIKDGLKAQNFDVRVDILAGNGQTIQSWVYTNCILVDYLTYLSENLVVFSFHEKFEPEIRERASYECGDFGIEVPE